jgi:hypothetical protein
MSEVVPLTGEERIEETSTVGGKDERPRFPGSSVVFRAVERFSFPCTGRGIGAAVSVNSFRISTQFLNFHPKPGRVRLAKEFSGI